jgi:hypothetical protein
VKIIVSKCRNIIFVTKADLAKASKLKMDAKEQNKDNKTINKQIDLPKGSEKSAVTNVFTPKVEIT